MGQHWLENGDIGFLMPGTNQKQTGHGIDHDDTNETVEFVQNKYDKACDNM